jgi:hypothetical protein
LLDLVFEDAEGNKSKQESEIVDDFMIENNFSQLRKKVFVKEKIIPQRPSVKVVSTSALIAKKPVTITNTVKKSAAGTFKSASKGGSTFKSASTSLSTAPQSQVSSNSNFLNSSTQ